MSASRELREFNGPTQTQLRHLRKGNQQDLLWQLSPGEQGAVSCKLTAIDGFRGQVDN
jgi:hypothetical protein